MYIFALQPPAMKLTSLFIFLFIFPYVNSSTIDLHDIIQLSDQIIMAELTDVCDDSMSATIILQLKGTLETQAIDIKLHSSESSISKSLMGNQNAILFLEQVSDQEYSLLFTLKESIDSNGKDHYIIMDQIEPNYVRTDRFIQAMESFIYNEQEISLEDLQP